MCRWWCNMDGTRSEDYLYDTENVQLDYSTVNVIGPASVADKIRQAVIEVDLTDQVESISESYRYTLCDEEGNPVDAAEITTDVEEIHLDMKIQRIKELKLVAQVTYGGGATEENTTITVNPASIRVTGRRRRAGRAGRQLHPCRDRPAVGGKVPEYALHHQPARRHYQPDRRETRPR